MREPQWFVGLDVHADSISLAALPRKGSDARTTQLGNAPEEIRRAFRELRRLGRLSCCYEASSCGFGLQRQLASMRIPCDVVAPTLIPRRSGDRVKTDARDALKLARLLRSGDLSAVRVPTPEEEAARDLVRAREDVHRSVVAARHRLFQFLLRHGRRFREGRAWTQRHWRWLRRQRFGFGPERITFAHYVADLEYGIDRRAELEREILQLADAEPFRVRVDRLSSLTGVSRLGAMTLLAEIVDFRRFGSAREFMAFVGLVPREHSSGGEQRRGGITRSGNVFARRTLVESAMSYHRTPSIGTRVRAQLAGQPHDVRRLVRRAQARLHARFRHLVDRGKKASVANVAVARELGGFVWALMSAGGPDSSSRSTSSIVAARADGGGDEARMENPR
jgi:transposase